MTVMDWVTLGIAVAGFVLSLASWIRTLWKERRRLSISFDFDNQFSLAHLTSLHLSAEIGISMENKSSNSITIVYFELCCTSGICYRSTFTPEYVTKKTLGGLYSGKPDYERLIESAAFPIQIMAYGAAYEYVHFSLPREHDWDDLSKVVAHTNRGNIVIGDSRVICTLQEFLQRPARERREKGSDSQGAAGDEL